MELHRVKPLVRIFHRRDRAIRSVCRHFEAFRRLGDVVRVAHPADGIWGHILHDQAVRPVDGEVRMTVFADWRLFHFAAQGVRHELRAVANPENRDAEFVELFLVGRRGRFEHAVRAAGQDDPLGRHGLELVNGCFVRMDFAVHLAFADPSGNELLVLSAEIQHNHQFTGLCRLLCRHAFSPVL